MDFLDPILLARIQFAFTVSFHILFPAFTIGLASYLAVLEGLWLFTRREVYMQAFRFWLPVFAVVFAMGVVSGIVMSYQFGTNWGPFAEMTADDYAEVGFKMAFHDLEDDKDGFLQGAQINIGSLRLRRRALTSQCLCCSPCAA